MFVEDVLELLDFDLVFGDLELRDRLEMHSAIDFQACSVSDEFESIDFGLGVDVLDTLVGVDGPEELIFGNLETFSSQIDIDVACEVPFGGIQGDFGALELEL